MRKITIGLFTALLVLQFASAIVFVPFIPHLTKIWNDHYVYGWHESYLREHIAGGNIMIAEAVVIFMALLCTIGFEIWIFRRGFIEDNKMKKDIGEVKGMLKDISNKLPKQLVCPNGCNIPQAGSNFCGQCGAKLIWK